MRTTVAPVVFILSLYTLFIYCYLQLLVIPSRYVNTGQNVLPGHIKLETALQTYLLQQCLLRKYSPYQFFFR